MFDKVLKGVGAVRDFSDLAAAGILKSEDDLNFCYKKEEIHPQKGGEGHKPANNTGVGGKKMFFPLKVMLKAEQTPFI